VGPRQPGQSSLKEGWACSDNRAIRTDKSRDQGCM
jgi:hypothetical protein